MSRKRVTNVVKKDAEDVARNKYGKWAYVILYALVFEVAVCLIYGWLSGNTEFNKISDNVVTALLQNYNFFLATILLTSVIAYIYARIKKELNAKFLSDNQIFMYGFLAVIVILAAVITVAGIAYEINSTTYYGYYSAGTATMFLCAVVIFVLLAIVLGVLKIIDLLKDKKELWKAIKKYLPIILMVMFLIWTFISCMLAPSAADDVIGAKAAEEAGASPADVLAKTLNGCYNLKDGYWAFLMYGTFLLGAMLIPKNLIKEKKKLIIAFVCTITFLSVLALGMSVYETSVYNKYKTAYEDYKANPEKYDEQGYTLENFQNVAEQETYKVLNKWYVYPQRGIFRNSNHFAYVLCMAVMAAAVLAIVEKKWLFRLLYIIAFAILLTMLIINNTFGGYLGVLVGMVALLIYGIIKFIFDMTRKSEEDIKEKKRNCLMEFSIFAIILVLFVTCSLCIKGSNQEAYVVSNIKNFVKDIGVFGGYMTTTENATSVDVSTLDTSITKAGSGRGETWIKVWELIKQRPLFGYGLECLLFQFSGQFGINEGRTHNLLLQLLATVGIPGTVMYFLALAIIFFRLMSNWKNWNDVEKICAFVGIAYMVTAVTGNSTYYTSPYFMMFLGFVVLTQWKKKEE